MVYGVFYCQQFRLIGNMDISIHSCLKRSMSKKLLKCFWMISFINAALNMVPIVIYACLIVDPA